MATFTQRLPRRVAPLAPTQPIVDGLTWLAYRSRPAATVTSNLGTRVSCPSAALGLLGCGCTKVTWFRTRRYKVESLS